MFLELPRDATSVEVQSDGIWNGRPEEIDTDTHAADPVCYKAKVSLP